MAKKGRCVEGLRRRRGVTVSFPRNLGTWSKGLSVTVDTAEPGLPGSNDVTVVTLNASDRTFSFALPDVEKGPVYVPANVS